MEEHLKEVRTYYPCPIPWCSVLEITLDTQNKTKKGKKSLSWLKWDKYVSLTSVHFSHLSNLGMSQRCFNGSRNPNSGIRRVANILGYPEPFYHYSRLIFKEEEQM